MLTQNKIFTTRKYIFFLVVFFTSLHANYVSIYDPKSEELNISIKDNTYIVHTEQKTSYSYKTSDGLKLFLPSFTTEYNLAILRLNSIGHINIYLSMTNSLTTDKLLDVDKSNVEFYLTNYKKKNQKQLDFLLKNKIIPYKKVTSLSFQGLNINSDINKKLNKWAYFTFFDKFDEENKLQGLVYSFSMKLDKKLVDSFVIDKNLEIVKHPKEASLDKIYTYLINYNKLSSYKIEKKVQKKEASKKKPKRDLKRFTHMKEFGYEYQQKVTSNNLEEKINQINKLIEETKFSQGYIEYMKNYSNYVKFTTKLELISKELQKELNSKPKDSCVFNINDIKEECFIKSDYFNKYVYFSIKNSILPSEEILEKFGNGKIFNDIGKYYFEIANYRKSEIYLLKSFIISKDSYKNRPAYNLGILYNFYNSDKFNKKAIKYLKLSDFKEAYFNLAINYLKGIGVKKDKKIAKEYFDKASKNHRK